MANHRRTTEEIERGLIAMVQSNGHSGVASELLASDGLDIPERTLRGWRTATHKARYDALVAEMGAQIRTEAAQLQRSVAQRYTDLTLKMADKLEREYEGIEARDLPAAARSMATVAAIAIDKADVLDDKPTTRVQIDISGTVKELESLGVTVDFIEGSAEEIPAPALTEGKADERKHIGNE